MNNTTKKNLVPRPRVANGAWVEGTGNALIVTGTSIEVGEILGIEIG